VFAKQHRRVACVFSFLIVSLLFAIVFDAPQTWRVQEAHAAFGPLGEFRAYILGDEHHLRNTADQFVLKRLRLWRDQRQDCRAVGRSHGHPAVAVLQSRVERQVKSQLVKIKPQAPVLVANIDVDAVHPQVQIRPRLRRLAAHARNYKSERVFLRRANRLPGGHYSIRWLTSRYTKTAGIKKADLKSAIAKVRRRAK
jgi:hypothetical protein